MQTTSHGTPKRVAFIGQAPAKPGTKHGIAGTYVRPWLERLGLRTAYIDSAIRFYALIGFYPGSDQRGHLKPTRQQITDHRPVLRNLLSDFQPDIVVPVGAMAISEILPGASLKLADTIGKPIPSIH